MHPRIARNESDWQVVQPLSLTMNNTNAILSRLVGSDSIKLLINFSHRNPRKFLKGSIALDGKSRSMPPYCIELLHILPY